MRTLSIHQVRNLLLIAVLAVCLIATYFINSNLLSSSKVEAGMGENVSGYAWSENVGWISLNSLGCDADSNGYTDSGTLCGGDNTTTVSHSYGVNVNTSNKAAGGTGDFSGYAWSENIGWISFDPSDLVGCPSGTCVARIDWSTGIVTGWAKVLGAAPAWDGWIKLGGDGLSWNGSACVGVSNNANTNRCNYGIVISGNKLSGYGWGGGDGTVGIGWIDFSPTINGTKVGSRISAPPCVATNGYDVSDPNMIWGSCQVAATCDNVNYFSGTTYPGLPMVAVGSCTDGGVPTGGTTVVSCGSGSLVCPAAAAPGTTKTHWWQF